MFLRAIQLKVMIRREYALRATAPRTEVKKPTMWTSKENQPKSRFLVSSFNWRLLFLGYPSIIMIFNDYMNLNSKK